MCVCVSPLSLSQVSPQRLRHLLEIDTSCVLVPVISELVLSVCLLTQQLCYSLTTYFLCHVLALQRGLYMNMNICCQSRNRFCSFHMTDFSVFCHPLDPLKCTGLSLKRKKRFWFTNGSSATCESVYLYFISTVNQT